MRIRFADCVFDSGTREVLRGRRTLSLSPKAFHLLEILIRERPKAVDRRKLHAELWPRIFVTDANLPNLVTELRSALGDDAREARIIRTIRSFGYAFCGKVAPALQRGTRATASDFHCRIVWGDREITLGEGENLLGRDPDVAVWIDLNSVSRRHARITVSDDSATLEDLGSRNGTYVGGRRVAAPRRLANGDQIKMGEARFVFRCFGKVGTTESECAE
ncbi:MAG TPA: FHA domain-containing protein [Thermoanaerobaculia bacterium]